ncbi:MAG TPA: dipeptidase [Pirellulales bacterium]|jgi:succinyl-diaminopimelate desuccinylase|nr:dipeptidase [Pirellulales bacterium]
MTPLDAYLAAHHDDFERDLFELLRIESVSAKSEHRADVGRAAQWVADRLGQLGLSVKLEKTAGHPIVYAESPPVPGAPTVLVYGHYDVQPVEPLAEWLSPPFEPTKRDGNVYARGATDDKGQMLTHVKSAEAWLRGAGRLPVQLKFVIEGEEEVGSPNLEPFLAANRQRLACDVVVISDTSQFAPGQPAITYGLRGIACFELRLVGPKQDLHSGTFGGAVVNPALALCQMLAALRDADGRVTVPGFYDDVVSLTPDERHKIAALPFDEQKFQQQIGVGAMGGEAGFTTLERRWARPTYDVNGMWSGYQGEGFKTVLPARAGAKFSFRLVPRQDPKKIHAALERRLRALCPPGIEMELIDMHGAPAVVVPLDSPWVAAASRAIGRAFGTAPVFMREGGSIPIVATFRELLGVDTLLLGWGLDDDNTHSPNEKFCLADFHRGIAASAYLWEELAGSQGAAKPAGISKTV